MTRLDRWQVCQGETAMAGAASAFLSISDLGLILDSPLWCSALTSRKMAVHNPIWSRRTYSTLIEGNELVFGAKKKLLETVCQMQQEARYAAIGVAVNCGPALMGDDVEGICQSAVQIPVCVADASGFSGDADQGWTEALLSLLKKVPYFSEKKQAGKVNILGRCIFDAASGTRQENVLFIPGCQPMKFEELSLLSEAELNLVENPRGLVIAKWLEEHTKTPYIIQYR